MSENKDNKLTLINEKTANDYLTHTILFYRLFPRDKKGIIVLRLHVRITDRTYKVGKKVNVRYIKTEKGDCGYILC